MKYPIAILGATGLVGQTYIKLLENHPFFSVKLLIASSKSSGRSYQSLMEDRWDSSDPIPDYIKDTPVFSLEKALPLLSSCSLAFLALPSSLSTQIAPLLSKQGLFVVSHASGHRTDPLIPLMLPEINASHLSVLDRQREYYKWKGALVAKPNCSLQSYLLPLHVIGKRWPIKKVCVTSLQSVSGAGYSGSSAMDLIGNILPFIPDEERKSENEPLKICSTYKQDKPIPPSSFKISAQCLRVPTLDGHLSSVSFSCEGSPSTQEILSAWEEYTSPEELLSLPMTIKNPLQYQHSNWHPQPKKDALRGGGMAITLGRLRPCQSLQFKFLALSHNLIRGAAGGALQTAELAAKKGYLHVHAEPLPL